MPAPPAVSAPETLDTTEQTSPTTAVEGTVTYTPADFARFAPRTALDMVQQIPDFELSQTSGDRGLGQASQNVLINGNRVSGKANDAQTALAQISASSVERIEISDGARLGIAGLTGRIANVIVRAAPLRIQYRWEFQNRRNIPDQVATGSISASGRLGATDFTLSLSNADGIRRGGVGLERVTDASNVLLVTRNQRDVFENDEPRLGATISRDWGGGRVLNLNASFTVERYRNFSDAVATTIASGLVRDENFVSRSDDWNSEVGGDYSFPIGTNGSLKIIALQYLEHGDFDSTFLITDRTPGATRRGSRFERTSEEGESVVRAEYDWGPDTGRWQFAVETAYNFLDTSSLTGALTPGGGFALAPLPGGASFVDEWRTEALLTRNWSLAPGMTLRTTAGAEASRISQTGAGGLTRRFVRPKGTIALAWTASPRATVNASIERRVGQLSFFDFTSGVNLLDDFATGSNTRLVPEQSWRARVELVRS
ncbi:MAG: TonB-dependent receptor, partial [Sphingopyxis sp.]|nr:TonB-dependent receptor [Sphingopyxis sp.]